MTTSVSSDIATQVKGDSRSLTIELQAGEDTEAQVFIVLAIRSIIDLCNEHRLPFGPLAELALQLPKVQTKGVTA